MTERIQTHWEDCWRDPKHHQCALARLELAYADNAALRAQLEEAKADNHGEDCECPSCIETLLRESYESATHRAEKAEAERDALLREKEEREAPCVWTNDGDGLWNSACGQVDWAFNDGGPVENKVKRCCGCGHPVQVKQKEEE